ncbi:MAG TPA: hypothetical protein VEL11_12165, partial [Candidatus Bathyarchaeia archaeon]|nr:hypothetical protein [Candidatus Bathyarchaeia archaeon]
FGRRQVHWIRQNSTLVDADTLKPLMDDIRALRKQIEQEEDKERKEDLKSQLEELKSKACLLIDLRVNVRLTPAWTTQGHHWLLGSNR